MLVVLPGRLRPRTETAMAEPLRVRRLREQLAAVGQYVQDLYSPIEEDYRDAPVIIKDSFNGLLRTLDEFDRQLAKLHSGSAVGGEVVLREEWKP